MLATEELNRIWLTISKDQTLKKNVHHELAQLYQDELYQKWWSSDPRLPFVVAEDPRFPILRSLAFIQNQQLQVKINRIASRLFITDGAWMPTPMRVFPDPDEALVLLKYCERNKLQHWAEWVIDPAAGRRRTRCGFADRLFPTG
ncbi:MAG: hypothetical protein OM95_14785 [Bdellovibrio sp. ArHS]|uniref:hypothetical protein n=1 Tax=Bdellovibrio sp. ArHS TaxID=1569284 RepID=UPI000583AF3F|nr:hypothetical protein [Bdellovibrio sp. ArHS]KHD87363.1 MAG: hypothetical protein OM95_14785 [Bdellovibrio sp. ArHS]